MYLKRLELSGFKSFADRTRLDFEPGISGVIGPNGCGKSNTSDAIRWCLGEQSARSMRSTQMLDVIFGGSQSRPTTGMAEVSLTFDNSQNVLPLDYSEVTVTRRLFKSGESEYFINKTQCRLKDIRDLFLDTGIGSEGYSIIEQGKVEFLLTARPEQRREMFEEAAGVSKYKVRREETLRKLDKVEVDMKRIGDMLSLYKEQITALDAAARKAKQYQKFKEDLKKYEVASLVQHVNRGQQEIERVSRELEPKLNQFETLNTTLAQTDADLAQVRLQQVERDDTYVKLHDDFSQIKSDINVADERIQQAAARELELRERQEFLSLELQSGEERIEQFASESDGIGKMREELAARVAALEADFREKEKALQEVRAEAARVQLKDNEVGSQLFALASEKSNLFNEQSRLESLLVRCQATLAGLRREFDRLKQDHQPLLDQITATETELEGLNQSIAASSARRETIVSQISGYTAQLSELSARQTTLKEKTVSLETRKQTLLEWEQKDPIRNAMRAVLSIDLPGIQGPVSSIMRIDPGMEDVVGAAFGERLNYMISDTVETAQKAIGYLETNSMGRLTFIVLDRLPESMPTQAMIQGSGTRTLFSLIQTDPAFTGLMKFLCSDTLVNGQSIYGYALIQGGSKISFDKPVLIEEQVRRIDGEIAAAAAEARELETRFATLQEQQETLNIEKSNIDVEVQRAKLQTEWLNEQTTATREKLKYFDREINLNNEEIAAKEKEEQEINAQFTATQSALTDLEAREQKLKEEQKTVEEELRRLKDEENRIAPLMTEAKVAWATQANELAAREREVQKMGENLDHFKQQLDQYRQELATIDTKIDELKATQESETERLRELHQEQSQKEVEVQVSMSDRQDLVQQLEKKNSLVVELRQQTEALKQEMHDAQMELRSYELQKQNMEQRLREDYGLVFEEVKDQYVNVPVDEEEMARIKRRIESLGAVNLAAPEEYAALEERFTFLQTQEQDLTKAREDLLQVIAKINQTTKENFKQTFDTVRDNFRNLYHQLFEGGESDLHLTDETNLLECGIEIFAQPPGKKLQNITLLSGGEKALTAIALLFAFFMVRPSPFCILDEVDAPLDDANIGRFINLIKEFSQRTQFLMITHNKRTMEMADVLYGVTMEELGVSKIISVRMNKAEQPVAESA